MANYTEKKSIAKSIKNISYEDAIDDFLKLQKYEYKNTKALVGNKCVDYFTFTERLDTLSNKGINFYDFLKNIDDYKEKEYVSRYLTKNKRTTEIDTIYGCFRIYFGSIGSFFPSVAVRIYKLYNPTTILDPFVGWGGRLVAALSQGISYIGYDTNADLYPQYKNIITTLLPITENKNINVNITIKPAETVDYSTLTYDMVFTSPPYYNIELYTGTDKKNKTEWNELYNKVFRETYNNLQPGGTFVLSINNKMYNDICLPLFGEATTVIPYVIQQKMKGTKPYTESIYVWIKAPV